jgi:acyl-Coa thioesterase superfamily protein/acyl-CoA thioesterase superfamily protein
MSAPSIFTAQDGRFVASELARGPWDPNAQHGGAPAALLMRAFERLPAADGLDLARVTYEFVRPVPLGELLVEAEVVRGGKRVQLLDGVIRTPDGVEVVRARALQVQRAQAGSSSDGAGALAPPETGRENDFAAPHRPMFSPDAVEIRFVEGEFSGTGPASAWFRLRQPLIAGEETSALQRLAAAADFGNGISRVLPWEDYLFINPDLTLYIEREPAGDWIGLQAQTLIAPDGIGTSESVLYDLRGRVGRAIQALLVARR